MSLAAITSRAKVMNRFITILPLDKHGGVYNHRTHHTSYHATRHTTHHKATFATRRVSASISRRNTLASVGIGHFRKNESGGEKW
jgi:hypothetical protein